VCWRSNNSEDRREHNKGALVHGEGEGGWQAAARHRKSNGEQRELGHGKDGIILAMIEQPLSVVFEGPVRSGYWALMALTGDRDRLVSARKLKITGPNRR